MTFFIDYLTGPAAIETGKPVESTWKPPASFTQISSNLKILKPEIVPGNVQQKVFVLAIISSSPKNILQRNAIRHTWGKYQKQNGAIADLKWKTVFMMGRTFRGIRDREVEKEAEKYGDIIRGSYLDRYDSITTKVLMAYNWAITIKCAYVFHGDDDIYVSFPNLIRWLTATQIPDPLYGGFVITGTVHRTKSNRHYVDPASFAEKDYPLYCKGALYVMSWKLLPSLVTASKSFIRITPDDAYIGILMRELGVQPYSIPGIKHRRLLTYFLKFVNPCYFKDLLAISDSLTHKQIYYVHRLIHQDSWFCIPDWIVGIMPFVTACLVTWYFLRVIRLVYPVQ